MKVRLDERMARMLSAACEERRREMGCSMEAVAAGANVATSSVVSALKDGTATTKSVWLKICDALDVDYEQIERECRKMREQQGAHDPVEAEPGEAREGVLVAADPVEIYRVFLFAEEGLADNLKTGTQMEPEQLYKLMTALYALRDAALALQPGDVVTPQAEA